MNAELIEKEGRGEVKVDKEDSKEKVETGKFKLVFTGAAAERLSEVSLELKKRGIEQKALVEMVAQEVLGKTESFWEKWMDEQTPGHFYLSAIQQDPDLQGKLEKFLKQTYLSRGKAHPPKGSYKKPALVKGEVEEAAELQEGSA